jgi:hypothetical protein
MKRIMFAAILLSALLLSACSVSLGSRETVKGSGVLATETRSVSGFDALDLVGSADITVSFGDSESLTIEAEDNILPLVRTRVRGNTLVIDFKPNTTVEVTKPIRITLTMKTLTEASIPGSGNITVNSLAGDKVKFDLPGSGNITAGGEVNSVNIIFKGSGNILCGELQAKSATVDLTGSGNVTVYASESVDITLDGSGNVTYLGNPANVKTSTPGSGEVRAGK